MLVVVVVNGNSGNSSSSMVLVVIVGIVGIVNWCYHIFIHVLLRVQVAADGARSKTDSSSS